MVVVTRGKRRRARCVNVRLRRVPKSLGRLAAAGTRSGSGVAPQRAIAALRRAASCSFTAYLITLSPEIEETILRQAAKHRRPHVSGRGMLRSTLHRSSGPDLPTTRASGGRHRGAQGAPERARRLT